MKKPFFVIGSVRVGRSQSIGTYDGAERRTAIAKEAVTGPVELTPTGFTGDEQFHTHVHGGPDKAVHQYPAESYGFLRHWSALFRAPSAKIFQRRALQKATSASVMWSVSGASFWN